MLNNIPDLFKSWPNFVLWRNELTKEGKPTKVPYSPHTATHASVTNPATWGTFEHCIEKISLLGMDGIGFVITNDIGISCIDLDDHADDPTLRDRQIAISEAFNSYSEISPSGNGLHIWVKGTVPSGRKQPLAEIYPSGRFMTMTGNVVNNSPVNDHQDLLMRLWEDLTPETAQAPIEYQIKEQSQEDNEVLQIAGDAENGMKFRDLWMGEYHRHGYPSQSEADQALINIIAYYTQDPVQIKRMFRNSALGQRDKAQRDPYFDHPQWGMIPKSFDQQLPPINLDTLKQNMAAHLAKIKSPISNNEPEQGTINPLPKPKRNVYSAPPGLIGEIAAFIYSAAPRPVPEIALAGAIGLMSGVCGRSYNISGTGLNQYTVLVAKTGRGKEGMNKGISQLIGSLQNTVPDAASFRGPAKIASPEALVKYLANTSKCFLSIIGEFPGVLKKMSNESRNPSQQGVKEAMLDLYNKSGKGDVLSGIIYSNKDKNTDALTAPAFSLLGEGTPEKFYELFTEEMIAEGFLPRFNVIEYLGKRPPLSETHENVQVPQRLVEQFGQLCAYALQLNNSDQVIKVLMDEAAIARLKEFDKSCDGKINQSDSVAAELWNRAHIKALKLSALLSVGTNYINPCISLEQANWAIGLIESDINNLMDKFERGEVGAPQNQNKQLEDLKKGVAKYLQEEWTTVKGYPGATQVSYDNQVIPHSFLTGFCRARISFKQDRLGPVQALKTLLFSLIESGEIQELAVKDKQKFGISPNGKVYGIIDPGAFL